MASKAEKIREQQKKKLEEKMQKEMGRENDVLTGKGDSSDYMDDLVNAIKNGELNAAEEPKLVEEPGPASESETVKEVPKKENASEPVKERVSSPKTTEKASKPAEKKESESRPAEKEEPMSLSSMLTFRAKQEKKSVQKSVSLRPTTMEKTNKLLKECYNGLSFNDLIQQLIDVWVAENEKHFKN